MISSFIVFQVTSCKHEYHLQCILEWYCLCYSLIFFCPACVTQLVLLLFISYAFPRKKKVIVAGAAFDK